MFGEGTKAFQDSYWINETLESEEEDKVKDDSFEPGKNKLFLRNESQRYVRMLSIHSPCTLGLRAQDLLVPTNAETVTQR